MKILLAIIMLVFSNVGNCLGHIVSYEEMKSTLFGSIQKITTCSSWHKDGRLGDFRVIELYYAGQDMIFIDIVALNKNQSSLDVVHGFSISEINNDHNEFSLSNIECSGKGQNQIELSATVTNGNNGENLKVRIDVDGNQLAYKYREKSLE